YLSADSWITLCNQIIKIYVVNRITPKLLNQVAAVENIGCPVESSMSKSNIYSLSEIILLKWVTTHYYA
ncbi:MAG: hypothetical protein V2I33_19880, partial [Kangiellaceae bacterium]|nr:hypothetical protein [Kangiellaceae bacterium]